MTAACASTGTSGAPVEASAAALPAGTSGAPVEASATALPGGSQTTTSPRTTEARAIQLLARATYGVRPQDVEEVTRVGTQVWLERQLHPELIDDALLAERLRFPSRPTIEVRTPFPPGPAPSYPPSRSAQYAEGVAAGNQYDLERARTAGVLPTVATPTSIKLERAIYSERQLQEVMTDFWFNHFNVDYGKAFVRTVMADYEATAIRANVFGKFEDMLRATAKHPAMLMYLDNFASAAPLPAPPPTPAGARAPAATWQRGINENYGRELLELHTLGVDGGYTQQDVIEVSRAFTGWSVPTNRPVGAQPPQPSTADSGLVFRYKPEWHDTGEKVVLGHRLPPGREVEDGLEVIAIVARHPSTAKHIATKLVRHFVSDEPRPQLVEKLASVFLATDGDLRELTRALFTSEEFYASENQRNKIKRPFEFVASVLRATDAAMVPQPENGLYRTLRDFRHLPYSEPAPTGYPTTAEHWVSASAMIARMGFAVDLMDGRFLGVDVDPFALTGVAPDAAGKVISRAQAQLIADRVVKGLLPGVDVGPLPAAVAAELERRGTLDRDTLRAAVALVLGSPEFERY